MSYLNIISCIDACVNASFASHYHNKSFTDEQVHIDAANHINYNVAWFSTNSF